MAVNEIDCGASRNSLDDSGVLHREKTLRHDDVKQHRQNQRPRRDQQRRRLMLQHPLQRSPVKCDDSLEHALRQLEEPALLGFGLWRSNREHIIGVSVSETTAETRIVTLRVMANSRNSRPTMSPMNSSGISTAISEIVSDMIVNPICSAPLRAASSGLSPSSI